MRISLLSVKRIGDLDVQIAGIPLFLVRTDSAQLDADFAVPAYLFGGPDLLVEALLPAVQGVRPVVERQLNVSSPRVNVPRAMRLA